MKQFIITLDRGYGYTKKKRLQGYYHRYDEKARRYEDIEIKTVELARKYWETQYPQDVILDVEEAKDTKPSPVGGDLSRLAAMVNG